MSTSRLGRRELFAVPLAVLLATAAERGQGICLAVRSVDGRSLGQTRGTAVQAITPALDVASFDRAITRAIWEAEAVNEAGIVPGPDDDRNPRSSSRAGLLRPMLRAASFVRDAANSDAVLLGPELEEFTVVRLLAPSNLGLTTLIEVSPPVRAGGVSGSVLEWCNLGARGATIRGLAFEEGRPTIPIRGNPYGPVSALVPDVTIRGSQPCVEGPGFRFAVSLEVGSRLFGLLLPAPRVTHPKPSLLVVRAAGEGTVRATVQDWVFRTDPAMGLEGMARFGSDEEGLLRAEARKRPFQSVRRRQARESRTHRRIES